MTALLVSLFAVCFVAAFGCSSGTHAGEVTAGGGAGGKHTAMRQPNGGRADALGESGHSENASGAPEQSAGAPPVSAGAPASDGGATDDSGGASATATSDGGGHRSELDGGGVSTGGASTGDDVETTAGAPGDEMNGGSPVGAGGASGGAAIAQGGSLGGRSGSANGNETNGGAPATGGFSSGPGGSIGDSGDLLPLPDPGLGPLYLPCDVARALSVCRNCHSNPPIHNTQYSLVTYADVAPLAPAIYDDIVSGNMPRPPFLLAPAAKAALLDWLGEQGSAALGVTEACE